MDMVSTRDVAKAMAANNKVIDKKIEEAVDVVSDRIVEVEKRLGEVRHEAKQAAASAMADVLDARAGSDLTPSYSLGKSYKVGDIVRHNKGLWQAFLDTEKAPGEDGSGWVPYINGVASQRVEVNGIRELSFVTAHSNGDVERTDHKIPVPLHLGKWEQAKAYDHGDMVMWDGCTWYCAEDGNTDEPGLTKSWVLAAQRGERGKKGETGARGEKGERGERGEKGLDGRHGIDADPEIVTERFSSEVAESISKFIEDPDADIETAHDQVAKLILSYKAPRGKPGEQGEKGDRGERGEAADPVVVAELIVRAVAGDEDAELALGRENVERVKGLFNVADPSDDRLPLFSRGGFKRGERYERGDLVSIAGTGLYVALTSTTADPMTNSPDWMTVAVISPAAGGGGVGSVNFLSLIDTPASYVGMANMVVSVKADESGLEFVPMAAAPTVIATVPPVTPVDGALWYSPVFDQLFIWDATNGYWVGV